MDGGMMQRGPRGSGDRYRSSGHGHGHQPGCTWLTRAGNGCQGRKERAEQRHRSGQGRAGMEAGRAGKRLLWALKLCFNDRGPFPLPILTRRLFLFCDRSRLRLVLWPQSTRSGSSKEGSYRTRPHHLGFSLCCTSSYLPTVKMCKSIRVRQAWSKQLFFNFGHSCNFLNFLKAPYFAECPIGISGGVFTQYEGMLSLCQVLILDFFSCRVQQNSCRL